MKKKITVMVEEELLRRVDELADGERRSRNNLIVRVLEERTAVLKVEGVKTTISFGAPLEAEEVLRGWVDDR